MSAQYLADLGELTEVGLDEQLYIEKTVGDIVTAYRTSVRNLLGTQIPKPTITLLTWNSGPKTLGVKADNLLPNSIISVDGKMYKIDTYTAGTLPNYEAVISIPAGLSAGDHSCKVVNFIHESADTFTV